MFEIAGHQVTYDDIIGRRDNWFQQYTMTRSQNDEWVKWGTSYIAKKLRMHKAMAKREMGMFDLRWGLKISEEVYER